MKKIAMIVDMINDVASLNGKTWVYMFIWCQTLFLVDILAWTAWAKGQLIEFFYLNYTSIILL